MDEIRIFGMQMFTYGWVIQFLIMVLRDERRKRLANEHKITLSEEGEVKKEIVANSLDELLDQLKDYLDESHTKN